MTEFSIHDNFDFARTYSEYGMATPEEWVARIESVFHGVTKILFLHNCIVIRTANIGIDIATLVLMKEALSALDICVATCSPWTGHDNYGLVYNIYFDRNCCPVKYPINIA